MYQLPPCREGDVERRETDSLPVELSTYAFERFVTELVLRILKIDFRVRHVFREEVALAFIDASPAETTHEPALADPAYTVRNENLRLVGSEGDERIFERSERVGAPSER